MYPVRFLRSEDTGACRLPDFLHLIPVFLLLQRLVRLALAGVILHRFLQAARTACVHRGRFLISFFRSFSLTCDFQFFSFLFFFNMCFLSGSVSSGRGYNLPIALAHLFMFASVRERLSDASFSRVQSRKSGHSSSCKPCVHARSRRTLSSDTSKIAPFIFGNKNIRKRIDSKVIPCQDREIRKKSRSFTKHFPEFLICNKT